MIAPIVIKEVEIDNETSGTYIDYCLFKFTFELIKQPIKTVDRIAHLLKVKNLL